MPAEATLRLDSSERRREGRAGALAARRSAGRRDGGGGSARPLRAVGAGLPAAMRRVLQSRDARAGGWRHPRQALTRDVTCPAAKCPWGAAWPYERVGVTCQDAPHAAAAGGPAYRVREGRARGEPPRSAAARDRREAAGAARRGGGARDGV